jgi:hypothetical protein
VLSQSINSATFNLSSISLKDRVQKFAISSEGKTSPICARSTVAKKLDPSASRGSPLENSQIQIFGRALPANPHPNIVISHSIEYAIASFDQNGRTCICIYD